MLVCVYTYICVGAWRRQPRPPLVPSARRPWTYQNFAKPTKNKYCALGDWDLQKLVMCIHVYEGVHLMIPRNRLRMCSRYYGGQVSLAAPPRESRGLGRQYVCDEYGSCQTYTAWLSSLAVSKLPNPRFLGPFAEYFGEYQ